MKRLIPFLLFIVLIPWTISADCGGMGPGPGLSRALGPGAFTTIPGTSYTAGSPSGTFDGSTGFYQSVGTIPVDCGWDYGSGNTKTITGVRIKTISNTNFCANAFKVQGSNTSSSSGYSDLFSRNLANEQSTGVYTFYNPTGYRWYRVYISSSHDSTYAGLWKLEFLDSSSTNNDLSLSGGTVFGGYSSSYTAFSAGTASGCIATTSFSGFFDTHKTDCYVGYDFGANNNQVVAVVKITSMPGAGPNSVTKDFDVMGSNTANNSGFSTIYSGTYADAGLSDSTERSFSTGSTSAFRYIMIKFKNTYDSTYVGVYKIKLYDR